MTDLAIGLGIPALQMILRTLTRRKVLDHFLTCYHRLYRART
jgi:hypothetical protein